MSDRKQTATHEAGHAVARERLGLCHGMLSIRKMGDRKGRSIGEDSQSEDDILVSFAGYVAERAAGFDVDDTEMEASPDFEETIDKFQLSRAEVEEWTKKTFELMSQPENISAVRILAEALLESETLCDEEVGIVVAAADETPENWRFELEQLRHTLRDRAKPKRS